MRSNLPMLFSILMYAAPAFAEDFYVSPTGNNQANGLHAIPQTGKAVANGPFRTLARAQQAVRAITKSGPLQQPITVHIAPGTYFLSNTMRFSGAQDSGTANNPIRWVNDGGADTGTGTDQVVISGGQPLRNCAKTTDGPWSCPVTAKSLPQTFYQGMAPGFSLFVNESRMEVARWPNSGWVHINRDISGNTAFSTMEQLPEINKNDLAGVQVNGFTAADWAQEYLPVANIDSKNNVITLKSPGTQYGIGQGRNLFLLNSQAFLDTHGEWFYDTAHSKILFYPRAGIAPTSIIVSSLNNTMTLKNVQYVSFEGLTFRHTVGTTIRIDHSSFVTLYRLEINNVDAYNYDPYNQAGRNNRTIIAQNSDNILLANSDIHDIGGGGITVSGGDPATLSSAHNRVYNNHFKNLGTISYVYSPAVDTEGVGNSVDHNLIEHGNGQAISFKGNNHLIEFNEIHHICEQAGDCGGIYDGRTWSDRGNIIRYNYLHDIHGYGFVSMNQTTGSPVYGSYRVNAIYLDDGMSGVTMYANQFTNAGDTAIFVNGGRDNHIVNNLIKTAKNGIYIFDRGGNADVSTEMATLTDQPYKSSDLWKSRYPEMFNIKRPKLPENNVITNNVIESTSTDPNEFAVIYNLPQEGSVIANNMVLGLNPKKSFNVMYVLDDQPNRYGWVLWQDWLKQGLETNSPQANDCIKFDSAKAIACSIHPEGDVSNSSIEFQTLPTMAQIGLVTGTER